MLSKITARSEVSPLRHVRDITARHKSKDNTAYETYCALPSPPKPYSSYDYAIIAEVIRDADAAVAKAYKKGTGSGIVTLQCILKAYEHVLSRHGIKSEEDTYYYRLVLKLSLDPEPDWWAKLNRETGTAGGRSAFLPASSSTVSSNRSTPRASNSRPSSVYRTSPSRRPRSEGTGISAKVSSYSASVAASVRSGIPMTGGGGASGRTSPHRSPKSLACSSDRELQEAIRAAVAQASRLQAPWEAQKDAAGRSAPTSPRVPASPRCSPQKMQHEPDEAVAARAAAEQATAAATAAEAALEVARDAVRGHFPMPSGQYKVGPPSVTLTEGSLRAFSAGPRTATAPASATSGSVDGRSIVMLSVPSESGAPSSIYVKDDFGDPSEYGALSSRYPSHTSHGTRTPSGGLGPGSSYREDPSYRSSLAPSSQMLRRSMSINTVASGGNRSGMSSGASRFPSDTGDLSTNFGSREGAGGVGDGASVFSAKTGVSGSSFPTGAGSGLGQLGSSARSENGRNISGIGGSAHSMAFSAGSRPAGGGSGGSTMRSEAGAFSGPTHTSGRTSPVGIRGGVRCESGTSIGTRASGHPSTITNGTRGSAGGHSSSRPSSVGMRGEGGASLPSHGSGRISPVEGADGARASGSFYNEPAKSEHGGPSTTRGGSFRTESSVPPSVAAASSRNGTVRSASASGVPSTRASTGVGGAARGSNHSSSAPGDARYSAGTGASHAGSRNFSSGPSSVKSAGGHSSRLPPNSFGGFQSDGGEPTAPASEEGGTSRRGSAPAVRTSVASLRTGSSIGTVPRSSVSAASGNGQTQPQTYSAWPEGAVGGGGGGGGGSGSGPQSGPSASSYGGSRSREASYQDPVGDDGFSFHSGAVSGSIRSAASHDGQVIRRSSLRAGVPSAGGFGHVSGGGADNYASDAHVGYGFPPEAHVGFSGGSHELSFGFSAGGGFGQRADPYTPFASGHSVHFPMGAGAGPQGVAEVGYSLPVMYNPYPHEANPVSPQYEGGGFPWFPHEGVPGGSGGGGASGSGGGSGGGGFYAPGVQGGPWVPDGGSGGGGGGGGGWGTDVNGRPPSPLHGDGAESELMEEAEAYMDFSRMARAFQTWRQNTSTRRISRSERDQALHNWAVATSFWAVHLLRRCFNKWRTLAPRKALMAMSIWGDNSRAGCFRRWLVFTRFLRSKGAQGVRLWRGRLIQRCWRRWRVFTWARQRKARAIKRARKLWVERTLRSCWLQWQDFTSDRQRRVLASEKAIAFWSDRRLQSCWLEWRSFTTTRRRLTLAMRRALAFWSDRQLLSSLLEWRQFTLDRRRKTLHMSRAIKFWTGSALQACWRQWRGFAAASRCKALATQRALGFWSARVRLSCVRSWRRYTIDRLRKAEATDKALRLWARSSLAACWSTWLSFTAKQQHKAVGLAKAVGFYRDRTFRNCLFEWSLQVESARQNMHLAETMRVRRLLHKWQLVASSLAKLLTAHDTIQQADRRRLLLASMQTLADAYAARDEASKRLRLALVRLQTRRLRGAFNKLRAVSIRGQRKRERSDMALEWWSSRCLARAWTAWRKAQESSIYATEAARDHALKILRPLLRNAFYGWLGWHEGKMMRRSREVDACRTLTSRKQHLVLGAWRGSVLDNIQLIAACQSIMRNEVHRLMVAAVRQLRREHDHARRAAEGRRVVQGGAARRCLRHWKALGQARQAQDELRIQRLRVAAAQRIRRILMAWQLVACLHAEHERLVHVCIIGMNRRWAAAIIRAWRGTVLDSVTMRMKMLAALLAWERGLKVRAWRAWNALLAASRASACRFAMAARHYRTRRLGLCFGALSTAWRAYRERLVRALRFRTLHTRGLVAEVLAAWKELVEVLKWKNMRTRRAVTHARHRLLAGSMYGWYYITRHRVESKHTVAVAVLHWVRRRRAATLSWWRAWATTHRALRLRGEGYWMVRAGRIKAGVFLRLRANVVRNLRIAAAVTHRNRYMARLALSGWLLRTLLAAEWVSRLQSVGTQLFWKVLEDSLATWQAYVVHRRRIHVMMRTAMHYWRLGRQRSALDSLRWHATRRQIMRAAVVRGCQRVASRVLRAWCTEAHYRRGLRDRFALLQFHTQRGTLKRSLDRWRIFLVVLAFRRDQNIVAVQHYLRVMMWTAFRRWYLYHMHLRHATERAQAILRRWRRRDAAVVLAAFAENVVFRRQMRDAESVFRITCSRRVFAAWQEFLGMKRATAFWRHKRLTGIVAAWRQYVRWRRGLRAIGAHVALRWRSLTAALVLATWRDLTRERQRLMELGFILATQTTRSALSALLLAWSEYATRSTWLKCIAAAIAARLRAKTLSTILTTWHVTAVRRAGLKRIAAAVTARSRHAALVIAFGFWYWHALNASRLRQISEQLSARTQRGLMATAMVAWCSHVGRAVRLRASHEVIATRVRLGALRATFFTWRGRTAYKVHLKSIEHQIIAKRCAYTSARVIGLWHSYASYKAHLRVAERKISRGLYVREAGIVLGEWRARAAYKARLHRAEKSVTLRIRMSALEDLFSSWRNWTQYKARLATTGAQVAWRQRRSWVIEVYSAWRSYAAYRAKLRGALEKVRTRRHRRMLAQACTTWRLYMLRMSALRGLLERVLMRATGLAFYGWREMVADAKRWRAIQEATRARLEQKPALADTACYAAARLRLWPLSLAFYTWYDNSKECRYLRGKASDAIFTYAGTLLRKALAMWLAYALRRRHMRQKLNRFRAVAKTKAQKATFRRWQSLAQYHRTLRLASRVLKEKVDGQTLRSAMQLWRATAARWGGLKGILARSMARLLSMAWDGWIEETIAGRERAQAVQVIGTRWAHRILADYLAAWRRLVSAVKAVRRLLARMQRRRKLWSWAAWQEAVFQGALVRGGELHRQLRAQRVLRGWRGVAEDVRRAGKLKAQMQQRKAHKVLMDWRRLWLARVCCRRVYYRRVLVGWYERTQELRQARARLWHATHVILYGSMARCFTVWRQHTQAMAIKRAVFVRKQRALADALRRGDELAARRNAELTELAFRAWRWLAIIYKEVQRRQAVATARMAAVVWAGWRKYTRVRRAREAKKDTVLRRRLLSRPLAAWRKASAAAKAKLGAAVMHRRTVLLESAMCAWFSYHDHVAARRAALRRALAAGNAAAAAALRFRAWEAWCEIMMRRIAVGELVEQAIRRRCRRSLQLAFDLWLKYTQAMHSGGIDPGSPYLTPRRRDADRRLVIRMAAMAGNEQALVGSDSVPSGGVLDGLYPSSGLKHAMERQQEVAAFLSLARHTSPSAGGAGGGSRGGSGATAGAAFASAMLAERQRLRHLDRDRRPSHDSGNGPSGSGSGTASMAGSSHASSITSTLSSGANGADLADLALQVVQVAPGLSPQGKGKSRGPSSAGQPQYVTGTAVQRPLNTFRDSDTGVGGSPYDDRLDLRALYDVAGTRASNVPPPPAAHGYAGPQALFGGFTPGHLPVDKLTPLSRGTATFPNPSATVVQITPRRIEFTAGRSGTGAYDIAPSYYGYVTASRSQQVRRESDSDVSTTSSDLLPPAEVRTRAAATAAADDAITAAATAVAAVSSWRSGTASREPHSSPKGRSWPRGLAPQATGGKGRFGGGMVATMQPSSTGLQRPAAAAAVASGGGKGAGMLQLGACGHMSGWRTSGTSQGSAGGISGLHASGGGAGGMPSAAAAVAPAVPYRGSILDRRAVQQGR